MAPRDAWNMTMMEYNEIMTVDKAKPTEVIYDEEFREAILAHFEVKDVLNG